MRLFGAGTGDLPSIFGGLRKARHAAVTAAAVAAAVGTAVGADDFVVPLLQQHENIVKHFAAINGSCVAAAAGAAAAALFIFSACVCICLRREKHPKDSFVSFNRLKAYGRMIDQITACRNIQDVSPSCFCKTCSRLLLLLLKLLLLVLLLLLIILPLVLMVLLLLMLLVIMLLLGIC